MPPLVLRRRVFRRSGVLTAEALVAGHRARSPRSLPEGRSGRNQRRVPSLRSCLSKLSDANKIGEPNGEPTSTGARPRQATSSHSRGWQMPHPATSSHVQRRYVLALQARGRRFEPCCAHCFRSSEACCDLEKIVGSLTGSQLIVILSVVGAMRRAPRGTGTPHSSASWPVLTCPESPGSGLVA